MTITITPEIEKGLTAEAQRQGTTPETLALDALQERFVRETHREEAGATEGSAYDLFVGRIGGIHGSHEALSQNTGERFTEYVVKKHQEGHL